MSAVNVFDGFPMGILLFPALYAAGPLTRIPVSLPVYMLCAPYQTALSYASFTQRR